MTHKTRSKVWIAPLLISVCIFGCRQGLDLLSVPRLLIGTKDSLSGIDADGDGLRDDIQEWIRTSFDDKPALKMDAYKLALAYQLLYLQADHKDKSVQNMINIHVRIDCLARHFPSDIGGLAAYSGLARTINKIMANNSERKRALIKAETHARGALEVVLRSKGDLTEYSCN